MRKGKSKKTELHNFSHSVFCDLEHELHFLFIFDDFHLHCWDDEVNTKWSHTIECVGARDSLQPCMDRCFCSCLHGSFIISDRCENWYLVSPASAGGSGPVYTLRRNRYYLFLLLQKHKSVHQRRRCIGHTTTIVWEQSCFRLSWTDTTPIPGDSKRDEWMNQLDGKWCSYVRQCALHLKSFLFVMERKREISLVLLFEYPFFSRERNKYRHIECDPLFLESSN